MTASQPYPGAPCWVKGLGIVALLAVVLFVVVHTAVGGIEHLFDHGLTGHAMPEHGPGATTRKQTEP
jgi:hypothetical protein